MYDFIDLGLFAKFWLSVFAPIFAAFFAYVSIGAVIDFLKRAAND